MWDKFDITSFLGYLQRIAFFAFFLLWVGTNTAMGQCAMCKAVPQTNTQDGNVNTGKGLNLGILYLLAMPFLLAAGIGVWWYLRSKKFAKEEQLRSMASLSSKVNAERLYGENPPSLN
ncbi:MAG: hypothetical protein AAGI38_07820 [Bacteroidota bacterium]